MSEAQEAVIEQSTTTADPAAQAIVPDFAIPEPYKEKGWAKNIKSNDDAWKMLDNAQTLAGKKTVAPDWEKATPKEVEDYYTQLRPADKAAYQFDETVAPEEKAVYADLLHKHGISAKQGNDLIKDYTATQQAEVAKMYDKDGFLAELKTSFGAEYEKTSGEIAKTLSANLNADDKALLEKVPNQFLGLIYRAVGSLNKAYGATEGGAAASSPASVSVVDVEIKANEIRDKLSVIDKRAHTADEKQVLIDELNNLYRKKA